MDIHARGSLSLRPYATVVFVVLCALSLGGCTMPDMPVPSSSPTVPEPDSTPQIDAPSATGPTAVVTIASVDVDGLNASVGGFVTDVSEDGGQCQFVITKDADGTAVPVDGEGIANVRSTSCGTHQIPIDKLSKGSWSVVLHYVSGELDLVSEPLEMEIP